MILPFWGGWIAFAVRRTHVITAIALIGASFYFIAPDLGLNRNIDGPTDGEEWQAHDGGFHHIQKYLVAPTTMPEHPTWLSDAALLLIVHCAGANLCLIDPANADLAVWQGVGPPEPEPARTRWAPSP